MIWFIAGLIVATTIHLYYRSHQAHIMFNKMTDRVYKYCGSLIANSTHKDWTSGITHNAIEASFAELESVPYLKVVFNFRRVCPENFWSEDFLERIK